MLEYHPLSSHYKALSVRSIFHQPKSCQGNAVSSLMFGEYSLNIAPIDINFKRDSVIYARRIYIGNSWDKKSHHLKLNVMWPWASQERTRSHFNVSWNLQYWRQVETHSMYWSYLCLPEVTLNIERLPCKGEKRSQLKRTHIFLSLPQGLLQQHSL